MFRSAYHYKISGMKIWVVLFAALGSASPLLAQEPTPPLVPQHSQTVLETLVKAGPVMIPMFLLSIFFVALVVVYFLTIRRGAVVSGGYMATADALLRKRDYLGLLAVSNRHGEAIARVVQKMLDFTTKNPHADLQQVREIAETEGTRVAASLNNRVIYLADIGMIAPLLGLLGTWPRERRRRGPAAQRPGNRPRRRGRDRACEGSPLEARPEGRRQRCLCHRPRNQQPVEHQP
jgi:biopolymer transport protein ExbB